MVELIKNRYVQLALAFAAGSILATILYPSKTIEESVRSEMQSKHKEEISKLSSEHKEELQRVVETSESEKSELKSKISERSEKINTLVTENRHLKESVKKRKFKLIKPDGTIIEKEYEESNTEEVTSIVTEIRKEFTEKIQETEKKWIKAYKKRIAEISKKHKAEIEELKKSQKEESQKLDKSKKTTINEKKIRLQLGTSTNLDYELHGSYNISGPIVIGGGVELKNDMSLDELSIGLGIQF